MKTETIYIDSLYRCHRTNDGTTQSVHTDFFFGMCDAVVEGFCCEITENGQKFYPWKPFSELKAAQAQYERDMAELAAAYHEGVNSV